jgi:hypothetical protein
MLEYIDVEVIAEDPTDLKSCFDPDKDEYPLPGAMWNTIKKLIFDTDIRIMFSVRSDTTNDSADDTQNNLTQSNRRQRYSA